MEVDHVNRNCYNYGKFEHMAKYYKNRGDILQFNNFRVNQRKEPYIRVNTRELDGVLGKRYLYIY